MKILEIAPSLDGGGIARLLYDYCSHLLPRIQFDFVVSAQATGILEASLIEMGCHIFHLPQMKKDLGNYKKELQWVIKTGNYDIVHDHCDYKSYFDLKIAKENGIKIRIAHSHRAFVPQSPMEKLYKLFFTPLTKNIATDLFACGIDAACWAWGDKCYKTGKVYIVKNAIDAKKFYYSKDTRHDLRQRMGLEGKFVVGNVARFSYQKNHEYLVDIFKEIAKINDDAILLLVGRGELFDEIVKKVDQQNIEKKVIFLGIRNDVDRLLNVMDVFVLPSRFEGLPVSLIEVQANGLPTYVSDNVTKEMKISENMFFLPLNCSPKIWADLILKEKIEREENRVKEYGYDIDAAAERLGEKYTELYENKK